jgi:hypothetical protein
MTGSGVHRLLRTPVLQWVVLVALLASGCATEARRLESLKNENTWLQMQAGNWILAHHAIPHSGIFSQSSDLPWSDPNWALQLTLAGLYRLIGIRTLPVAMMVLRLLFVLAMFLLARGRRGNFWLAAGIALWAQAAMLSASTTPFALLSSVLLTAELVLLLESRDSGQGRLLYGVPLLILVWANFDWHFVFGIAVLLLFCVVSTVEELLHHRGLHFGADDRKALPSATLGLVLGATFLGSLISPSSYHSYGIAWQNLFGASRLDHSLGMKSLTFREPQHYLLMFLAMFAFLLLGRQRARDLFLVVLLCVNVCLGFAFGNETWIVAVTAVAVIGMFVPRGGESNRECAQISAITFDMSVAAAAVVLIFAATRIPADRALLELTANSLPVRACDFVRKHQLPGPIYNELEWGGFLAWYLPEYPLSIDDRYELYGEARTKLYYDVTRGLATPSSDPTLGTANTILISIDNGLIKGIQAFPNPDEMFRVTFPGFHEVYRDDLAVVLTKQP